MKKLLFLLIVSALASACNNKAKLEEAEALRIKQITIDSLHTVVAVQKIVDSMITVNKIAHTRNNEKASGFDVVASETPTVAVPAKKKGWSSAAKGAVIGAGTGAVAGALIDKNHGEGAIVGGLLGAGLGAGTGALIDKSKKKKINQ